MGLQICGCNLNQQQKELQPHGTLEFPCAGYWERHAAGPEQAVPWHWHDELEIICLVSGSITVRTPAQSHTLGPGDCAAINSGVLHSADTNSACELRSLVFHPSWIAGGMDSVLARKYLSPLTACPAFRLWRFDREREREAIQDFSAAFDALASDAPGFEFVVRERLSAVCYALYRRFESLMQTDAGKPDREEHRIQIMMDFIHQNFSQELSLSEIAAAAGVGERECLRCFQKTIQISPMQYLLKHRIMRGAQALLDHPADSIARIATSCGFDSPSNFSQQFKRFYNRTPREYRAGPR